MKTRYLLLMAVILLLLLAGLAAWIISPRVATVFPQPGSLDLPGNTAIQLTFSQSMDIESLPGHVQIEPETQGRFTWNDPVLTFTPDQPWGSGQIITITLQAGARASAGPGLPVWSSTAWSFQISEMLLVYLWPASDLADLYTLNPLTSEITRLTEGDAVRDFSASPDGKSIFYTADRLRGGSVIVRLSFDLTEAGAATSTETVATCENAVCRSPAASPNGRWLAFEKTPERGDRTQIGIWLLDMLSGESQPAGISGNPGRYPIWSAEGWLAYYDLTDQAYRAIHPESKSEILMPNQIGEQGSWRSDGSAFLASEIFDESSELLISAASGHMLLYSLKQPEDIVDLTREYYLEDTGGVIAPNGTQIAFTRKYLDPVRWTAGRQLWVMDIGVGQGESSSARPITDAPQYNHYGIAWSPDSQRIAYMRFNQVDLTQLPELWLINADGSNPTQLVIGGYAPQWVP